MRCERLRQDVHQKCNISCLHRDKQDQPHSMLVQGPLPILDFGSKSKKIFLLKIFLEGRECWRLGGGCHNWPFSQVTHPPASGHHRLKATIDNCLTTENPADCDFPPESFLPLEKLKLLLMRIYEIQIQILLQGGCWQWLTSHMVKTLEESFGRKFLEAANHFNANPSAATLHSYPTFKASLAMTRWEKKGSLPSSEVSAPRHFGMADVRKAAIVKDVILWGSIFPAAPLAAAKTDLDFDACWCWRLVVAPILRLDCRRRVGPSLPWRLTSRSSWRPPILPWPALRV